MPKIMQVRMSGEPLKVVKVNCSFCGKEIECPEDMIESKKHACFECFMELDKKPPEEKPDFERIHVDIPTDKMDEVMPKIMMDSLMGEFFPELWREQKARIKEMSRKELAEAMFAAGASIAIHSLLNAGKEPEEMEKKNPKRTRNKESNPSRKLDEFLKK